MAEIIGAVSAVVSLAEVTVVLSQKFVRLVKDYVETDYRVQTIADDAQTTHAILAEFDELRKHATLNTQSSAFHLVSDGVRNCRRYLELLHKELQRTVDHLQTMQGKIKLRSAKKLSWLFRAEDVRNIRDELSRSQQTVLLGVSLTQVKLHLRAPGVPLSPEEESRLHIVIRSTLKDAMAQSMPHPAGSSVHGLPGAFSPLVTSSGQGLDMGFPGGALPSPQPPELLTRFAARSITNSAGRANDPLDTPSAPYTSHGSEDLNAGPDQVPRPPRERLDRVPKGLIPTIDLDGLPWLKDPFEDDKIVIYKALSDAEYRMLIRPSQAKNFGRRMSPARISRAKSEGIAIHKPADENVELGDLRSFTERSPTVENSYHEYEVFLDEDEDLFTQTDPYEDGVAQMIEDWITT